MKRAGNYSIFLIFLSACATGPKNPSACKVWSNEAMIKDSVYVEDDAAFYGAGCFTGRFGCKWKEAKFEGDDIVIDGELSQKKGKFLTYKNDVLTLAAPSGLVDKIFRGATTDGVSFQFLADRVVVKTKLIGVAKMINVGKEEHIVNVKHSNCTNREAAIGVGFILAGRK